MTEPSPPISDKLLRRLADLAATEDDFAGYRYVPAACACSGNYRPTDPRCQCGMWSLLGQHKAEVLAFQAANPDYVPDPKPFDRGPADEPTQVFIRDSGTKLDDLQKLAAIRRVTGEMIGRKSSLAETREMLAGTRPVIDDPANTSLVYRVKNALDHFGMFAEFA